MFALLDDSLGAPAWATSLIPWLLTLLVVAAGVAAVGVWMLLARLREIERFAERFQAIDAIASSLDSLVRAREDLDLRRVEHVLIEMRDGQRRLEDALLRAAQSTPRTSDGSEPPTEEAASLSERVVRRLLAHGYEQVHVVPSLDELAQLFKADGAHEVLVEARRNGVACKGRVLLRDGVVTDVELKPAYTMFP
jgi:hypothetical protein